MQYESAEMQATFEPEGGRSGGIRDHGLTRREQDREIVASFEDRADRPNWIYIEKGEMDLCGCRLVQMRLGLQIRGRNGVTSPVVSLAVSLVLDIKSFLFCSELLVTVLG